MKIFLHNIYRKFKPIRNLGNNNKVVIDSHYRNVRATIRGNNNTIIINRPKVLSNLNININGDNCCLTIMENCRIYGPASITIEDGAHVSIGNNTGIRGLSIIAKTKNIIIGNDCMTSYNIIIRNTDGHKVIDQSTQKVTNEPQDIIIGNHVWLGQNSSVLKGVAIGDNSIVALGAVVTKKMPPHSIIAGNPAKVVKTDISWIK